MALTNSDLPVWEIAFRWEGLDPDALWPRLPLAVRDRFRTLMDAVLNCRLECETMSMDKYDPNDGAPPEYYIRHYLTQIENCIRGQKYDRKMLKWAHISREALEEWCKISGEPLPKFWFPAGLENGLGDDRQEAEEKIRITDDHRARMACQQVAKIKWSVDPTLSIEAIARSDEIQKWAGMKIKTGATYSIKTIAEWLGEIDKQNRPGKRGRKPQKNSGKSNK